MTDTDSVTILSDAARAALRAIRRMKSCIKQWDEEDGVIKIYNGTRYWPLTQLRAALAAVPQPGDHERAVSKAVATALEAFRNLYDWMERDEYGDGDNWDDPPYQMHEIGAAIAGDLLEEVVQELKAAVN